MIIVRPRRCYLSGGTPNDGTPSWGAIQFAPGVKAVSRFLSLLVSMGLAAVVAAPALAGEPPATEPTVSVTPNGQSVVISGAAFHPGERVNVRVDYTAADGKSASATWAFDADQAGRFQATEPIAVDAAAGLNVEAVGDNGSRAGGATIADGPAQPADRPGQATRSSGWPGIIALVAAMVVLGAAGFVLWARRGRGQVAAPRG